MVAGGESGGFGRVAQVQWSARDSDEAKRKARMAVWETESVRMYAFALPETWLEGCLAALCIELPNM